MSLGSMIHVYCHVSEKEHFPKLTGDKGGRVLDTVNLLSMRIVPLCQSLGFTFAEATPRPTFLQGATRGTCLLRPRKAL